MKIDWAALGVVAGVSIVSSVAFVLLLATGIRLVSAAQLRANQGSPAVAIRSAGYGLLGMAGLLVLLGIYLIIPQFH